ncbi:hypothetical protein [Mycobacterium bohemicum]|uniref:hypothetical protein n=1 Tax=Mycobacterium bohemicum TaxID=56425 RepID=UPI000A9B0AD4|nr:hypothetical protein [Mycobacterium bohemicum]
MTAARLPSPSAVADNVYYCSPSAATANACWPSTPGRLLCVDNPWNRSLHRVTYSGALPPVQGPATPDPFALTLRPQPRRTVAARPGRGHLH